MFIQANFHGFETYDAARNYFETTTMPRGWPEGCKPLSRDNDSCRRKKHFNVRLGNSEELIYCLYRTDVFTHYPDGRLAFETYPTVSTDMFLRRLCPMGLNVNCMYGDGILWVKGADHIVRGYEIKGGAQVRRIAGAHHSCWEFVDASSYYTISYPVVDRRAAKAAREKYNYSDFATYIQAIAALQCPREKIIRRGFHRVYGMPSRADCFAALAGGPKEWLAFAERFSDAVMSYGNTVLRRTLTELYIEECATKTVTTDFYKSISHYYSISTARRIYG